MIAGCFLLLLCACSGKNSVKKVTTVVQPSIIHPLFFQEEIAAHLNFPFWFNDSIIRKQGIQSFTWRVYRSTQLDDESNGQPISDLKIKVIYTFNEAGKLISVERNEYSEGLKISERKYALIPTVFPSFFQDKPLQPMVSNGDESTEAYVCLVKNKPRKRVDQYEDNYNHLRYHFFPDKKYWGPLSIDSIGRPGENDWVIRGTPDKPKKRYQVHNTVTERNVTHYDYYNDNYPHMIRWTDYPFTQHRHFNYSKNGVFTGFIDSTFVDQAFVTRNVSVFDFDALQRPIRITHKKAHADGDKHYQTIETIDYILFPTKQ
ncbi:MAG: hypothetical protein A3D31_12300 [Candidatus Fluviicola riflensis]|nr:MAG: hypothetical protein CHH17_16735 [Candidatus Fluviicola riflensis]OGS77767.1 MAG: hypothetical protein A3D31_12300 [Candidatus Fluviicola riflensis]OGS84350.1 MAG: hypothetical protein A3E30_13710 [Fluviicola sp. RIFCSPHIGHO2_12_FULL_43_24]OGS84832.1 MAG: hypothetical protein A2724_09235 [Fluviicola sp. RIFCSPHIGHO2_01_FULL_43_53]